MSDEVLNRYVCEVMKLPNPTFNWQGGEPTLMGLDFFKTAVALTHGKATHTIQTNGLLIDKEWCQVLKMNNFLVGISLDGPPEIHDRYRGTTCNKVLNSIELLKSHKVPVNILACIHHHNADQPLHIYKFLKSKSRYLQFIPVVELIDGEPTPYSVGSEQYGQFLTKVFNEWSRNDVGEISVQIFDSLGNAERVCTMSPYCESNLALEHNGDVYCCDHFVDRNYLLGNILRTNLTQLIEIQRKFKYQKSTELPLCCGNCKYVTLCYGDCPKNRLPGKPSYLCAGLKNFFRHVDKTYPGRYC